MQKIGSRAEVLHGSAMQTAGGLKKSDLFLDKEDGRIKSKTASKAADVRMKREMKVGAHLTQIWQPEKGEFKVQPGEGNRGYKTRIAKHEIAQRKLSKM